MLLGTVVMPASAVAAGLGSIGLGSIGLGSFGAGSIGTGALAGPGTVGDGSAGAGWTGQLSEVVISTGAALLAAALFALTTNLQRKAASTVPSEHGGPLHLVRRLFVDRYWLLGGLIGCLALGLHALALAGGAVLVVQSVMALGLVLTLVLEAFRERRRMLTNELLGALLVVGGVIAVVCAGAVPEHPGAATGGGLLVALVGAAIVGVTLLGVVLSRRGVSSQWAARFLAGAGGACLAVDAVFLQRVATAGLGSALTFGPDGGPGSLGSWSTLLAAVPDLAAFLAASAVGGIAIHRAYQVAPLRSVQPAVAAAEPLTAFLIGATLLHESVRWGAVGYLVLVLAMAAVVAGIVLGLRAAPEPVERAEAHAGQRRPDESPAALDGSAVGSSSVMVPGSPLGAGPSRLQAPTGQARFDLDRLDELAELDRLLPACQGRRTTWH